MIDSDAERARDLLDAFARRTGVTGDDGPQRRYLWTDAFAVCTWLGIHAETGDAEALARARALVDRVHGTLGRHRPDDPRTGWISGLGDVNGARHPTVAGLRIGKSLPERSPGARFDREAEWDRDGQYYHYLTRWILGLARLASVAGDAAAARHAAELATAAHRGFAYRTPAGDLRLYWKMSIDLERPLVPSMGQHDPLGGLVAFATAQAARGEVPRGLEESSAPRLDREIRELTTLCLDSRWATDDPLGVGSLLSDTLLLARLLAGGPVDGLEPAPGTAILEAAAVAAGLSVRAVATSPLLHQPADRRLAFRELGLSLGLAVAGSLRPALRAAGADEARVAEALDVVEGSAGLRTSIHEFWLDPDHRTSPPWRQHRDINEVMLAASLAPGGCLGIESPTARHGAAGG